MKVSSALSFFIFLILPFLAAGNVNISGLVNDSKNEPLAFANVVLIQSTDSIVAKAGITDEGGRFLFEDIGPGSYRVLVAQLGFQKYYSDPVLVEENSFSLNLLPIQLNTSETVLNEVNVSAFRPLIEHKIDRTILNVENSIINAGANVLEILKRSPGVNVDYDGNIFLNGKQGVLIMIDGKPTYLSQKDLYEMFRNTSSDQISTIEIITNPSAKYDAAGTTGIINIRMRKKVSSGFNGRVQASYGQGEYPDFGTGFFLSYGSRKLNLFAGYDYTNGYYYEEINLSRKFDENGGTSTFKQYSHNKGQYLNNVFRGGIDYFLSEKSSLGLVLRGNRFVNHDNTTSQTDVYNNENVSDSGYVTYNNSDSKWSNISSTLNFLTKIDTTGKEFSLDADLAHYDNSNDFEFITDHYFTGSDSKYTETAFSDQPAIIDIYSLKTDYVHPFHDKLKFEAGLKSSYVKTDSDVKYYNNISGVNVLDSTKTNHFIYKENINAGYVNFSGESGKFGVQAGLRVEQTISSGDQQAYNSTFSRNYTDLFPSFFLSYTISEKHLLKTSYSKRVDRPAYQQLNPFKYFIDPYNYMEGNPLLTPQLTNSFELSHTYKQLYTVGINYSHTTDAMTQIIKQIDSIHTTYVTTENIEAYDNFGININVPVTVTEWFQSTNNFNLFSNRYKGVSSVGPVDESLVSYTFNSTNNFSLPAGITAELVFTYSSEMIWGTMLLEPIYSISGGISKMFLKDRVQARLNFNDVFHTDIMHSTTKYQNIDVDFERVYDSQFFRIHVSYKFGKQTQRSARRSSGSQEEQNRVRQGR
jgi:hypothetical protein